MLAAADMVFEDIYMRSLGAGMRSVAITSSGHGEGVSSLAVALAQRHLLAGRSALFVDLASSESTQLNALPVHVDDIPVSATEPQLLTSAGDTFALLGIPAPANDKVNLQWRNPGILENYIAAWLDQFDAVIVDAGNFHRDLPVLVPAERIVSACESTLLVVMAGSTSEPAVRHTCERILCAGGKLAGCVLNERYNPSLKQELLRESARLPRALRAVQKSMVRWINRNRLLSLEV